MSLAEHEISAFRSSKHVKKFSELFFLFFFHRTSIIITFNLVLMSCGRFITELKPSLICLIAPKAKKTFFHDSVAEIKCL